MKNTKRILLAAVAALLLVAVSVGGTLAWLVDKTDPVTNTFTAANIKITLTEDFNKDSNGDNKNDAWEAQLIPGKEYAKNPVVAVNTDETTVPIYVYVKVDNTNASTYVDYELITTDWTLVPNQTNVYYRAWDPATDKDNHEWHLLKDDKVTVKSTLTKEVAATASATLTFTAYAIQQEGFTPETGWAQVSAPVTP